MASSSDNLITLGLKGAIGKQLVFRKHGNKLIVAKMPAKRTSGLNASEVLIRKRFKEASTYAKAAIKDSSIKAFYQESASPGQTAYNMAFADFFSVPEILEVNLSAYTGRVGSKIGMKVTEDFKVAAVNVSIQAAGGELIESGQALITANELDWSYTAKVAHTSLPGTRVLITASDLAGNTSTEEKVIA